MLIQLLNIYLYFSAVATITTSINSQLLHTYHNAVHYLVPECLSYSNISNKTSMFCTLTLCPLSDFGQVWSYSVSSLTLFLFCWLFCAHHPETQNLLKLCKSPSIKHSPSQYFPPDSGPLVSSTLTPVTSLAFSQVEKSPGSIAVCH